MVGCLVLGCVTGKTQGKLNLHKKMGSTWGHFIQPLKVICYAKWLQSAEKCTPQRILTYLYVHVYACEFVSFALWQNALKATAMGSLWPSSLTMTETLNKHFHLTHPRNTMLSRKCGNVIQLDNGMLWLGMVWDGMAYGVVLCMGGGMFSQLKNIITYAKNPQRLI